MNPAVEAETRDKAHRGTSTIYVGATLAVTGHWGLSASFVQCEFAGGVVVDEERTQ